MIKKIIIISFTFILIVFNNTIIFAGEENNSKTISELKQEIKKIDKQKEDTGNKLDKLKKEIYIKKFFKTDLIKEENEKLNLLVIDYINTKNELRNQLEKEAQNFEDTKETIKKLLINEKEIYKKLLAFIKIEKYEDYKNFIKKDLEFINLKLNLETSQTKKEKIVDNKVKIIKEKIREHKNILNDRLINIVNKKIDSKLNQLIKNEKFLKLEYELQIELFQKLILKIETRLKKLKEKENKTKILNQKIELYKIIIKRVLLFKNNYEDILKNKEIY